MKANADKYHLLVTTNRASSANIEEFVLNNSNEKQLLSIKIDTKLSFENHVSSLRKKASQKLHALARIVNHMDLNKHKCLMKAFVTSQFNYCPLIWMFHNRELNNRLNRIHERALRLVYQNNILLFSELLEKDNFVTMHQRNLQLLATEVFKLKNGLAPEIMKEVFEIQNPADNFRLEATHFKRENIKTTHYGIQLARYLGQKIWDIVPNNKKNYSSLNKFKNNIRSWKPNKYPCRLCKRYIAQVGFILFTSPFCNISEVKKIIYILYFWRFFIYFLYLFIA